MEYDVDEQYPAVASRGHPHPQDRRLPLHLHPAGHRGRRLHRQQHLHMGVLPEVSPEAVVQRVRAGRPGFGHRLPGQPAIRVAGGAGVLPEPHPGSVSGAGVPHLRLQLPVRVVHGLRHRRELHRYMSPDARAGHVHARASHDRRHRVGHGCVEHLQPVHSDHESQTNSGKFPRFVR